MDKKLIKQLFRFGIVGGIAFLIDYFFLYFFTDICGLHYLLSASLAFILSMIFNYTASVKWVYDVGHKQTVKDVIIFTILSVIGLLLNELIMFIGVDLLKVYYMIVKIFSSGIVMIFNFITRKLFLEKE